MLYNRQMKISTLYSLLNRTATIYLIKIDSHSHFSDKLKKKQIIGKLRACTNRA